MPNSSSSSSPSKKSVRISVGCTAVERDSGLSSSESLSSEEAMCSMDLTGDAASMIVEMRRNSSKLRLYLFI